MTDRELLEAMYNDMQEVKKSVSNIEERVSSIEERVTNIEERVTNIEERVSSIEERVTNIEERVTSIEERVSSIEERVTNIEERVSNLEESNTSIKLILENEIRVNIQRVAEGHLDLSRNLHDAMRPSNEVEMLAIKVRMLESDVHELKQKFLMTV